MSAGRSRPVLDIPQGTFAPELTGYLVGLAAILQELARESPMTVIFQPGRQSVLMTNITQATYIIVRNTIGYQTAQIPQEAV